MNNNPANIKTISAGTLATLTSFFGIPLLAPIIPVIMINEIISHTPEKILISPQSGCFFTAIARNIEIHTSSMPITNIQSNKVYRRRIFKKYNATLSS